MRVHECLIFVWKLVSLINHCDSYRLIKISQGVWSIKNLIKIDFLFVMSIFSVFLWFDKKFGELWKRVRIHLDWQEIFHDSYDNISFINGNVFVHQLLNQYLRRSNSILCSSRFIQASLQRIWKELVIHNFKKVS